MRDVPATAQRVPSPLEAARKLAILAEAARGAAASGDLPTALLYARMLRDRIAAGGGWFHGSSGILAAAEANAAVFLLERKAVDRALEAIARTLAEVRAAAR